MKRYKYIVFIPLLAWLTSCSDWLTLEPAGKVIESDFWKQESDVESVVATCYREMLEDEFMNKVIVWGELRADNIIAGDGLGPVESKILEANIQPDNAYTSWNKFYSVINYCNTVLHYAPRVKAIDPDFTTAELNAKQAEVLTLRALCYFYLIRTFKDVPLILEPTLDDIQEYKVAQSTEQVIIQQLISDLIKAEGWAMKAYSTEKYTKGRITKNAVRALLADIYLWNNDYSSSIQYCNKIIDDKASLLKENETLLIQNDNDPYYLIFGKKNSDESIFELQFDYSYKVNSKIGSFYGDILTPSGDFSTSTFLATGTTVFPVTDTRKKDWFNNTETKGLYQIFKYAGLLRTENIAGMSTYIYRTDSPNWIFYRLTDVMLMKAEALVQLNRNEQDLRSALNIVNTTYKRSNPTILNDTLMFASYSTQRQMEELVLLERQRELMFEGKRWFDLLRLARRDGNTTRLLEKVLRKYTIDQTTIKSKMSDINALYMPINEDEIKVNPLLKQNPFYETNSTITY